MGCFATTVRGVAKTECLGHFSPIVSTRVLVPRLQFVAECVKHFVPLWMNESLDGFRYPQNQQPKRLTATTVAATARSLRAFSLLAPLPLLFLAGLTWGFRRTQGQYQAVGAPAKRRIVPIAVRRLAKRGLVAPTAATGDAVRAHSIIIRML